MTERTNMYFFCLGLVICVAVNTVFIKLTEIYTPGQDSCDSPCENQSIFHVCGVQGNSWTIHGFSVLFFPAFQHILSKQFVKPNKNGKLFINYMKG